MFMNKIDSVYDLNTLIIGRKGELVFHTVSNGQINIKMRISCVLRISEMGETNFMEQLMMKTQYGGPKILYFSCPFACPHIDNCYFVN